MPGWLDTRAGCATLWDTAMRDYDRRPEKATDGRGTDIIEAGDEGVVLSPLPEITEHREPVEQGAALYHRCEGCGRESIYGAAEIVHAEDCPRRELDR